MRAYLRPDPRRYTQITLVALVLLTLIVLTGAAVRLTGSGLGCPDWPKCYGKTYPPLNAYALIEFGNRALSGLVGVTAIVAAFLAWFRRPFRRDLAVLGSLLPLGVVAQAVLGGFTVRAHLAPGYVMAHFVLSMLILDAAVGLHWRARFEPGDRPRSTDRVGTWATRALMPIGALTILVGTAATAAGPHAGGEPGQRIHRLTIKGTDTLNWAIYQHGKIAGVMGVLSVVVWLWLRRRGAEPALRRAMTYVVVILGLQGVIGIAQYELKLPPGMVWVHVSLASCLWVAVLFSVAAAGRLVPRAAEARAEAGTPASAPAGQGVQA
jgi:heme a synthase